jgi:nicotinate-nucleotide adenylyltransferase
LGRLKGERERLGIFGGTFDPPHVGHLILAMEAYDQLKLDKVLWVLAPNPPHKLGKRISPLDVRIEMVQAAIQGDAIFEFSRVDIDRPGPHYVLDTMRILRGERPDADLVFLMGGDSLHDLSTWHMPDEFIQSCDSLGVMHRPGEVIRLEELEKRFPGISAKVEFIEAPLLEISSNQIRSLAMTGKPFRYYLPYDVYTIVEERKLYLNGSNDN